MNELLRVISIYIRAHFFYCWQKYNVFVTLHINCKFYVLSNETSFFYLQMRVFRVGSSTHNRSHRPAGQCCPQSMLAGPSLCWVKLRGKGRRKERKRERERAEEQSSQTTPNEKKKQESCCHACPIQLAAYLTRILICPTPYYSNNCPDSNVFFFFFFKKKRQYKKERRRKLCTIEIRA